MPDRLQECLFCGTHASDFWTTFSVICHQCGEHAEWIDLCGDCVVHMAEGVKHFREREKGVSSGT